MAERKRFGVRPKVGLYNRPEVSRVYKDRVNNLLFQDKLDEVMQDATKQHKNVAVGAFLTTLGRRRAPGKKKGKAAKAKSAKKTAAKKKPAAKKAAAKKKSNNI